MPSFVKKLASRAAKRAVNKVVDRVTDKVFGNFGGTGRILTFGTRETDPRFQTPKNLIDYRSTFHKEITENYHFATPNRSLWYVVINDFPVSIKAATLAEIDQTNVIDGQSNAINDGANHFDNDYQKVTEDHLHRKSAGKQIVGCLFAQGCQIPQESVNYSHATFNNMRNFIPGVVGGQRNPFNPLTIEFRETQTSFLDVVLRPWIILASHYGLVTYPEDEPGKNIKTTIDIYQLGLQDRYKAHTIRKRFTFYNCFPFQIAQQSMTYDIDSGSIPPIDTQWMYSHYKVTSGVLDGGSEDGSNMTGFSDPATNQVGGSVPNSLQGIASQGIANIKKKFT